MKQVQTKREFGFELLKFIAILLVVNSHMNMCYPPSCRFLATGGAIGVALFFLTSGYTLFLGRMDGFAIWYKRRLGRIFPTTLVCCIIQALIIGSTFYERSSGCWFIRCILLYYVFLYFIRRYLSERLWVAYIANIIVIVVCYFACFSGGGGGAFMVMNTINGLTILCRC